MPNFRKKPVVIEAVQWSGDNFKEVSALNPGNIWLDANGDMKIRTAEGVVSASLKDFVIRGVVGEVYPCKRDIFQMTYDPVLLA